MNYFLGTYSFALALVLMGAGCHADSIASVHCDWVGDCACNDGTVQLDGCAEASSTCTEACADHGGFDGGAPAPPAPDASDVGSCLIEIECPCDDGTVQFAGCSYPSSCPEACMGHGGDDAGAPAHDADGGDGG